MQFRKIKAAFTDHRGSISDVFYKAAINHVGVIESVAGVIRGNHYHKETTQHTLVTRGGLRYYWQPADKSEALQSCIVFEGEMVTSGPNEIHAMYMFTPCQMIVFSEGVRGGQDYESDTYRVEIIKAGEVV